MPTRGKTLPAVLLCGGSSERLGYPKEMLRVDGAPLAVKLAARLKDIFASVSVSSNNPLYLRHLLDVPVHEDEPADCGPLAGILTGLRHCGAEAAFFLACDMPNVHGGIIERLLERAEATGAQAVVARASGRVEPLCAVYRSSLIPIIEHALRAGGDLSVRSLLGSVKVEHVDFSGHEAECLHDVDTPQDLWRLRKSFSVVEPLPVRRVEMKRLGAAEAPQSDVAAEEWAVALLVNGIKVATVLCLPAALVQLAVGFASYLGLLERREQVRAADADYEARRVSLDLDVPDESIGAAVQGLVTSTCGANVYGPEVKEVPAATPESGFRVRRSHILDCVRSLRHMAPVFARTGCTHQAAFSDGAAIRLFHEDVGRHNAVDKVVGSALMGGTDLRRGLLVTTGRMNAEMVLKALRQGVPCLASRSAPTAGAVDLAGRCGLTLAGFARGGRLNLYCGAERVTDE